MNISGVGEMGVGEMGQIIGETGVGEMGTSRKDAHYPIFVLLSNVLCCILESKKRG